MTETKNNSNEGSEGKGNKKSSDNNAVLSFEKPKNSIAGKFGAYLSVLILTTVLFMTFYGVWTGINLIQKAREDIKDTLEKYSTELVSIYHNQLLKGDYIAFDNTITKLIHLKKIRNVYIFDKIGENKGIIKYSPQRDLIGKEIYTILDNKNENKNVFEIMWDNITFSRLNEPNFINYVHLDEREVVAIDLLFGNLFQVTTIYRGYIILAILFITCGFISAVVLAKMVTKPIFDLYIGAGKFAKGEWDTRIAVQSDDEIGKLAESFNRMAEELSQIYESLEMKVKERTRELEEKHREVEVKNNQLGKAYDELKAAQVKLVHSEKMSSLGQLVAGVAHELNNPINFIYGNMEHLKNYAHDLKELFEKYQAIESKLSEDDLEPITDFKEEIDYEYLIEDLDDLLDSCKEGAERTRQIVLDLRNFSRLDEASLKEVNIHEGIDSTLNILHNKYKNRVTVKKDYDNSIPLINCFAGQLNQVFMNLLANAAQAIDGNGEVQIVTKNDNGYAKITITDNGCGISPDNLSKIFDPFFTTKDVGEGTGLGLSVSYGIIEKHNGTISVESKVGEGTTFTVKIPLKWKKDETVEMETDDLDEE